MTKGNFLQPFIRYVECSRNIDLTLLKGDISNFLDENRSFESKSARELIAVNVSDMSGNVSKYPHTVLAGAFLSAASLKVVAKEVI